MNKPPVWLCRGRALDLSRPLVMGIVNATPDSFSDGGEHASTEAAVAWGERLAREGADIIDVGGESTRPGAEPVSEAEEIARVAPVIRALAARGLAVSADTMKAGVMAAALEAGAVILNDVAGFRGEGAADLAARSGAGLVVMHMRGDPRTMQDAPACGDVVAEVEAFLRGREAILIALGADPASLCRDPGFGFGKTDAQNFALLAATGRLASDGRPVMAAVSRKSSLGRAAGVADPRGRDPASVAASLLAVERGARVVRVHDVAGMRQALSVRRALLAARSSPNRP
ncbi:MAG: dihydropteroate synthase [Duodenibacillus sp.]|nr:dihydropteroate synthase [Duodenibacillus sp.]